MRPIAIRGLLALTLLFSTAVSAHLSIVASVEPAGDPPCSQMADDESPCPCCPADLAFDCARTCTVAPMIAMTTAIVAHVQAVIPGRVRDVVADAQNRGPPPTPPPIR